VRRWQEAFLGRRELPADLSDFEIEHFFTFDAEELKAICSRRTDRHRLAAALHVGFIKTTGTTLNAFDKVPRRLLKHLGRQLQIRAPDVTSLRALYRRRQTLFDHQNLAAGLLGFSAFTGGRRSALRSALKKEAQRGTTVDLLVCFSNRWLYEHKILLPSERTLRDFAYKAHDDAEQRMYEAVRAIIPQRILRQWHDSLFTVHAPFPTTLEWLQQPPRTRSTNAVGSQVDRVQHLRDLGVDKYALKGVSLERQRAYAASARRRRPARLQTLAEPRRTLEIVCLLRLTMLERTDYAISSGEMRGRDIVRQAKDVVAEKEKALLSELEAMTEDIERVANDVSISDAHARQQIRSRLPKRGQPRTSAARLRQTLSDRATKTRPLIKRLMDLDLREGGDQATLRALALLRDVYSTKNPRLPKNADGSFAPRWRDVIEQPDRARALRGFEAATLESLRNGLRSGTIWAPDSIEHRNKDEIFISAAEWKRTRREHYRRMELPQRAEQYLKPVKAALSVGLEELAAAVRADEVTLSKRGVHLKAITKEEVPDEVASVRKEIFDEIGPVQLPDLLVEMDSLICFSHTLLGRAPRSEAELLSLYGAVLSHGTAMSTTDVEMMTPEVSADSVASMMLHIEDEAALRAANTSAVDFLRAHAIAKAWGDGTMASADGMSLEATRWLWLARVDPRHRRYSVGTYTHLLDQWGIIYDQPYVLGNRQVGAAIEGAVRQEVSDRLAKLAVDTHGFSRFGMAASKLLKKDLCPRLQNLKDRRIHVPRGFAVPKELRSVVDRDVSTAKIDAGYDGLVQVVASIKHAGTSADLAMKRYGSAASRDPVYQAGNALGMLQLSVFLCDYFTNPPFRREMLRLLDLGETIHGLQRKLFRGSVAPKRGRRREELIAISGSLTLLTNLTMAWWTHKMQAVLDRWERVGRRRISDEVKRHISPAHSEGLNCRGQYAYPLARYAERILIPGIMAATARR
jgi:TnpA family transposase